MSATANYMNGLLEVGVLLQNETETMQVGSLMSQERLFFDWFLLPVSVASPTAFVMGLAMMQQGLPLGDWHRLQEALVDVLLSFKGLWKDKIAQGVLAFRYQLPMILMSLGLTHVWNVLPLPTINLKELKLSPFRLLAVFISCDVMWWLLAIAESGLSVFQVLALHAIDSLGLGLLVWSTMVAIQPKVDATHRQREAYVRMMFIVMSYVTVASYFPRLNVVGVIRRLLVRILGLVKPSPQDEVEGLRHQVRELQGEVQTLRAAADTADKALDEVINLNGSEDGRQGVARQQADSLVTQSQERGRPAARVVGSKRHLTPAPGVAVATPLRPVAAGLANRG